MKSYLLVPLVVIAFSGCQAKTQDDAGAEAPVVPPSRLERGAADEAMVSLDRVALRALDIRTAPLAAAHWNDGRELNGEVVAEPERTTAVRAPLGGRLATEGTERWPRFGERIEAGTAVGHVADARPLLIARAGTITRVGAQPGELVDAGQVLLELTDYAQPVARLVWPDAAPRPPATLTLHTAAGRSVTARLVGAAPEADPVTRLPAFLYRADHAWAEARPGLPVTARLAGTGGSRAGVRVPAAAVVQWDGFAWVYLESAPARFVRRRIDTAHPLDGGDVVDAALAVGARVVVRGAQALLSEEFRSRISVGDESDH